MLFDEMDGSQDAVVSVSMCSTLQAPRRAPVVSHQHQLTVITLLSQGSFGVSAPNFATSANLPQALEWLNQTLGERGINVYIEPESSSSQIIIVSVSYIVF